MLTLNGYLPVLSIALAIGLCTLLSPAHKLANYIKPALIFFLVLNMSMMIWLYSIINNTISFYLNLAYSFCLFVALLVKSQPTLMTSERLVFLSYAAASVGLISTDLRIIFGSLGLSLLPYLARYQQGDATYRRRLHLFLGMNLGAYTFALACLYTDLSGFDVTGGNQISVLSWLWVYASAFLRTGLVPFHSFHRLFLQPGHLSKILTLINPLALYPILLLRSVSHVDVASPILDCILYYGLLNSLYLVLASFQEAKFSSYLFYIASSLLSLLTVSTLHLAAEPVIGLVYFLGNTMVALSAMAICLNTLRMRYGAEAYHNMDGFALSNQPLAYAFLFFVLVASNIPMTMSFLGEDIILYELFKYQYGIGMIAVLIFSLQGISLFRFYTKTFCGTPTVKLPIFPLLSREKVSLSLLVAAIAFGPLFAVLR